MITGSFSLALCTVVFRRLVDTLTGRIPTLPVSNPANTTTAVLVFSGFLYYLYNHLRRGTLVSIGQGQQLHQRHSSNKSWFLKNMWGRRKNCTDAICRLAKTSLESVTNMNPCLLLPKKSFRISFPDANKTPSRENLSAERTQNSCNVIYNNDVFQKESDTDLQLFRDLRKGSTSSEKHVTVEKKKLKRLKGKKNKEKKIVDLTVTSHSGKFQGEKGRRTRSGKVYSPFI